MNSLTIESRNAKAQAVNLTDDTLSVDLAEGKSFQVVSKTIYLCPQCGQKKCGV